jgi:hypothetical protein
MMTRNKTVTNRIIFDVMMFIHHHHRPQGLGLARSLLKHQAMMFVQSYMKCPEFVPDL